METANINLNIKTKQYRETGFEILRIISMFLITCVHVMNYGGMLEFAGGGNIESQFLQKLLYSIFTTSVNIYVLISGYFLINSKFKIKRIINLWLQVVFYAVVGYIVATTVFDKVFELKDFLLSFIPITNKNFWFISAYFLMYLFSPFLNVMLKNLTKKQYKILMIGICVIVYISTRFDIMGILSFNCGCTFIWFCLLYIVGAYFKLYPPQIKKNIILVIYLVSISLTWIMFVFPPKGPLSSVFFSGVLNNDPLVFVASISLLLLFRNINIGNSKLNKIICYISSCMFGVYLFQDGHIKKYIYFNFESNIFNISSILSISLAGSITIVSFVS